MTATPVVLAHRHDHAAWAVARRVQARGLPVRVLAPERLAQARWSHRIGSRGRATTVLRWADGDELRDDAIGVLLHRAAYLPQPAFARATPRDRDYAAAELQALVLSWLGGLGGRCWPDVRQAPAWGASLDPARWQAAARAQGLAVAHGGDPPADAGRHATLTLVDGAVLGLDTLSLGPPAHSALALALHRCASALGQPLAEVDLHQGADGRAQLVRWREQAALATPAAVAAVAAALVRRCRTGAASTAVATTRAATPQAA